MAAACPLSGPIMTPRVPPPLSQVAAGEWFAAQVWAGREHVCARHLLVRGYDVFLPCYQEHRRWSDRVKKIERALFTGYVFCRTTGHVLERLLTTPGVIRIAGDGRRPLPIADEEIDAIRRAVESGLTLEPSDFLDVGQRVRVEAGPLRDTEGIVVRVMNQHRLIISVSLLRRSVAVELDPASVSALPPTAGGATRK